MPDHRCPSELSAAREIEPTVTNSSAAAGVSDGGREKYTKEMKTELRGAMLVVMSLVASVTYQAGLILPDRPPVEGAGISAVLKGQKGTTPTLLQYAPSAAPAESREAGSGDAGSSLAFATLNGFAFSCSVCNMILLMTEFVFSSGTRTDLMVIKGYMIVSLVAMAGAYGAGSCRDWDCTWNYCMWVPSYFIITTIICCFVHRRTKHGKKTAATSGKAAAGGDADVEMQSVQPHGNIPPDLTPSK